MAKGLPWFKLWSACLTDPSLDNLTVEDFGRWVKVLAITSIQGDKDGQVLLTDPSKTVCAMLQVPDFDSLFTALQRLPNLDLRRENVKQTDETLVTFQVRNWHKYQVDTSTDRVRRHRDRETTREDKIREEKIRSTTPPLSPRGGTFSMKETLKNHPATRAGL